MPLLGFTVFRDKIELGEKSQTIRMARKHQIKKGDKLYLYWKLRTKQCEKIGEAVCSESYRMSWSRIREDWGIIYADGFTDDELTDAVTKFVDWFESHYNPNDATLFDIIRWEDLKLPEEKKEAQRN